MTKGTARHTFVSSRTEGDTPGMPHMATALQPSRSWGWALACFAFIMASASHSCATLQPCSQHTLQTHWAMILLGQNSSNMSYKPTQCPKNLISSGSALLQILLQAVCSREFLLPFWGLESKFHIGFEWAKHHSDSMQVF